MLTIYCLMIAYLTILQYFKVTDKNLVDTQLKKKNKKLYRQKKSFLKISYEEKSNILASRVISQTKMKTAKGNEEKMIRSRKQNEAERKKEKKEEKEKRNL